MDLKPAMRENLEKVPLEQKKLMLAQYRSRAQAQPRVDDNPQYFVTRLKGESDLKNVYKNVQALGVFIRSKPKSWVQAFVKVDGLSILFELLATIERNPKYVF